MAHARRAARRQLADGALVDRADAAVAARRSGVDLLACARAQQSGDTLQANQEFEQVAGQFNFYGQLAGEETGQRTTIPPRTKVSDAEIDAMSNSGLRACPAFLCAEPAASKATANGTGRCAGMTDRQLLAAAEYGKRVAPRPHGQHGRPHEAESTTSRCATRRRTATSSRALCAIDGLDTEWAYGLIRQESRFIISARSSVGAGGLMQLMPATAQMVAKKLGMGTISRAQMHDIDTNIQLGMVSGGHLQQLRQLAGARHGRLQRGPGPRQWRQGVDAAGRRRDLRRNDSVQRDARLREERAVEHRLLRGALRGANRSR